MSFSRLWLLSLLPLALSISCKTAPLVDGDGGTQLSLISGGGKTYDLEKGISICYETVSAFTDCDHIDEMNAAFKAAIEEQWGAKIGIKTYGYKPCTEMADAEVRLRFFDCQADGTGCPDKNKSPHVAFIGPPAADQGPNYVNLRCSYRDHYRYNQCNNLDEDKKFANVLEARKHRTYNYAVHEFGHIIGFDHEQYHPDGPAVCRDDTYHFASIGPGAARWKCSQGYDDESVMNYCGKEFLNWGRGLSAKDIVCAKEFAAWAKKNKSY